VLVTLRDRLLAFNTWKFRTMVVGAVNQGLGYNVAKDNPGITCVGRFLCA